MNVTTAASFTNEIGPLTAIALEWCELIEARAQAAGATPEDFAPLSRYLADDFERVGAYMEVMKWDEYVQFLAKWAGATRFETTIFRITEVGRVVVQEIEERHYKGDEFIRKNVVAIYDFDHTNRIRRLQIYEQAKDTGRWIVEAARESVGSKSG